MPSPLRGLHPCAQCGAITKSQDELCSKCHRSQRRKSEREMQARFDKMIEAARIEETEARDELARRGRKPREGQGGPAPGSATSSDEVVSAAGNTSLAWIRRALAVLAARTEDPDAPEPSRDLFAEMVAPVAGLDERATAVAYAAGANKLASILLGMVALERGISRREAVELLSLIVAEIDDDPT